MAKTSSPQPNTFAQVVAQYSRTSARCVCQSTITLGADGEWAHPAIASRPRTAWCRNGH